MENQEILVPVKRFIEEGLNKGNVDIIHEVWAKDMLWEGGSMGTVHGLDDFTNNGVQAFSDMHLTILDYSLKDNQVWVRFTDEGTQVGTFMGYPASHKHAVWNGFGMYTVEDGKIKKGWFSEDILSMLMQFGHIK
ncbi:MAG: ester cyclase [Lactococcus lactis]|nr:ester cyclase [Lactococcus lactis]